MNRPLRRLGTTWKSLWNESPLLVLGAILTLIASLVPIWIGRYLPLLDYPGHLANLFVWRHLHDPQLRFDHHYELNLQPLPYWIQYGIEYLLAIPFGAEVAQKLFLTLAIGLLPASVALYAKQLGRDPWLAVLAIPLAWNMNVSHGFLAFIGGLPLLFLSLWALDRFASQPSMWRGLLTVILGVSLYFSHILVFGSFLLIGGFTSLLARRPLTIRQFLLAPLPLVPVVLIGVWAQLYGNADKTNLPVSGKSFSDYAGPHNDFLSNIGMIPSWTMNVLPGHRDDYLYAAILLGLWLILFVAGWRSTKPESQPAHPGIGRYLGRAEVGLLLISILYFSLPRSLLQPFYWYAVNRRLAVLVCLFALLLIRGSLRTTWRRNLLFGVMALSIIYSIDISAHFLRFNRRNRGFDELMAQVPVGKSVLPLMLNFGDEDALMNCFNQWGGYVQMRQGGYMTPYFPIEFPVRHRSVPRPQSPPWDAPRLFRFSEHGKDWDYFLLHGPSRLQVFTGAGDSVRLVDQRGDWSLYENSTRAR